MWLLVYNIEGKIFWKLSMYIKTQSALRINNSPHKQFIKLLLSVQNKKKTVFYAYAHLLR